MLNLNKIEDQEIFSFEVFGDITEREMHNFIERLEEETKDSKIKLLGIYHEFPGFESFSAFNETLKLKAKAIKSIEKYAILSNKDWIEALIPIGNSLTPGLPMKAFKLEQKDEAIAWLNSNEETTVTASEYLTNVQIDKIPDYPIYRFVVDNKLDKAGVEAVYKIIEEQTSGKINLMAVIKEFDKIPDFEVLASSSKFDLSYFAKVGKYAIVTDKKWISKMADLEDNIFKKIEIKSFKIEQEDEALKWLKE